MARRLNFWQTWKAKCLLFSVSSPTEKRYIYYASAASVSGLVFSGYVIVQNVRASCSAHVSNRVILLYCYLSQTAVFKFLYGFLPTIAGWVIYIVRPNESSTILDRWKQHEFADKTDGREVLAKIALPKGYVPFPKPDHGEGTVAATNPDLNVKILTNAELEFNFLPTKNLFHDPEILKKYVVFSAKASGSLLYNSPKIRVAGEIDPGVIIDIERTDYLSYAMTDNLAFVRVDSRATKKEDILYDGLSRFLEEDKYSGKWSLMPFSTNSCANLLAVSTLAFSSDGYLITIEQSDRGLPTPGEYATSGSGSVDFADFRGRQTGDLREVLEYSARRELSEECALDRSLFRLQCNIGCAVRLFAFTRLIRKSGKPEFFAFGWIDAHAYKIVKRKHTWSEQRFTKKIQAYTEKRINPKHGPIAGQIREICRAYLDRAKLEWRMSYQLRHSLELLSEACGRETSADEINRFFSQFFPLELLAERPERGGLFLGRAGR